MTTALATAVFILNIEGTVHMGNIFKDMLDSFSSPSEPVKAEPKSKGLGAKSSMFIEDPGREAEKAEKSKAATGAATATVAKMYTNIVKEQIKDDNGNTPTVSTTSVAYNSTSDDESDLVNQGYYPDKIIRDSMLSGKLGSSSPRRSLTSSTLDNIEAEIKKFDTYAARNARINTKIPSRTSRDVDALEGPEASGPITKKVLSPLEIFKQRISDSYRYSRGIDPESLANPQRGLMGRLGDTEDVIGRSVIDLEGPQAGDYASIPLGASEVQRLLGVTVDGKFGKNSKLALKAFQRRAGLPVTGEYKNVATQAALQQTDSSDPRNTAGLFDAVTNVPKILLPKKGSEYRKSKLNLSVTHYAEPLVSGGIRGNSRVYGDASEEVQTKVINKIILEGKRAGMNNDQIAMTLAIANVESGFNPDAAAGTTSAAGLGQFIDKTGAGYSIDNTNRWDLDTQVTALIEHTLDNYNLVAKRDKADKYVYKYHHDGPTSDYGGLKVSERKVMPLVKKYKKLLEG